MMNKRGFIVWITGYTTIIVLWSIFGKPIQEAIGWPTFIILAFGSFTIYAAIGVYFAFKDRKNGKTPAR